METKKKTTPTINRGLDLVEKANCHKVVNYDSNLQQKKCSHLELISSLDKITSNRVYLWEPKKKKTYTSIINSDWFK